MLQRMSTPLLVFEWDDETGDTTMVTGGGLSRDRRWEITQEVWAKAGSIGLTWEDLEWRERVRSVGLCVPWNTAAAALLWRAKFSPVESSRTVAVMVATALGVELEPRLEE